MNKAPKQTSYFCPACHSPVVNLSSLAGGEASCGGCSWKGRNEDLLGHSFESGFENEEAIVSAFVRDIKLLLAREGVGMKIGQLILKWGFVTTIDVPTLSRYVGAVARGITVSILEERRTIEKEKQHVS
jgi:hypothetical protein